MADVLIEVKHLKKSYGNFTAVDDISFEVQRGEIFGILGPNGAGKTTALECLEGLRVPDSGDLRIMGINPVREVSKLRNSIGVQLQTSGLPASMTVREAMRFFCAYHNAAPNFQLLERMGLKDKMEAQYHSLSTGLQRRLALALAMAHNPPVIFLDEPTAGLDVPSRAELHQLMGELRSNGISVLLATHDMAEAEKMADRVAILMHGKIVTSGTPRALTASGSGFTKVSVQTQNNSLLLSKTNLPGVTKSLVQENYSVYYSTDIGSTLTAIMVHINEHGDTLIDLRAERPSLEERFLEITGKGSK